MSENKKYIGQISISEAQRRALYEDYKVKLQEKSDTPITPREVATFVIEAGHKHIDSYGLSPTGYYGYSKTTTVAAMEACTGHPEWVEIVDYLLTNNWNDSLAWAAILTGRDLKEEFEHAC
jgi:hypothetical protein